MRGLMITAAGLIAVAEAFAGDIVPPDPWEVIHIAREIGEADVGRDAMNDPRIEITVAGRRDTVTFYGCRLGRNCRSVLFQTRFSQAEWADDPPPGAAFEGWNAQKLFGRAWWSDADEAILDHPVAMQAGLPRETLIATFEAWLTAADEFREYLDIPKD